MRTHVYPVRLGPPVLLLVFGCGGGPADVQSPTQLSPGPLADLSPVAIEVPGQVRLDSLLQLRVVVHNGGARTAGPAGLSACICRPARSSPPMTS